MTPSNTTAPVDIRRPLSVPDTLDPGAFAAGLGAVGLGLGVAGRLGLYLPGCPLRLLTGVPCPGCGMTHLIDDLVTGRVGTVIAADPAALTLVVVLGVLAAVHLWARVARRPSPARRRPRAAYLVLAALLAAHWATTAWTGGLLTA